MDKLVIFLSLFGIVFCENIPCWTLEQINDQIYLDNDLNQDDSLDATERLALVTKWGINDNPSGIPLSTFVNQWVALYHDSHTDAHAFAVNLDVDRDHFISQADIAVIFMKYDVNGNGDAEKTEFMAFLNAEHPTKGNGNHGCH